MEIRVGSKDDDRRAYPCQLMLIPKGVQRSEYGREKETRGGDNEGVKLDKSVKSEVK